LCRGDGRWAPCVEYRPIRDEPRAIRTPGRSCISSRQGRGENGGHEQARQGLLRASVWRSSYAEIKATRRVCCFGEGGTPSTRGRGDSPHGTVRDWREPLPPGLPAVSRSCQTRSEDISPRVTSIVPAVWGNRAGQEGNGL
jgi:hypothetical protein